MKKFKISQIQFQAKSTPFENSILLNALFLKSIKYKPDLICTPECSNIVTNNKLHLFKHSTSQEDCPIIINSKIFAKKYQVNINLGSLLLKIKGKKKLANRSILINKRGNIQTIYDKIHLFDAFIDSKDNHCESESFFKGSKLIINKIDDVKIGHSICYDIRFPNLYRKLAKRGAQIILIPAAFTTPTGKAHWETLIRARAIENSVFVVATGMCGTHHSGRKTYGHSMISDPWGNIENKCSSLPKIINTTIDLEKITNFRSKISSIYDG